MSLFGELAEGVVGSAIAGQSSGGAQNQIAQELIAAIANHPGGLPGLLTQFESAGFAQHVASWVGTGGNLPISADQIQQALGSPMVEGIAAKLGIDPGQVSALCAQVFPKVVDQLTPAGAVTEQHHSPDGLMGLAGMLVKQFA